MLPDTLAPAPEILPSVTVTVELAVGSQLPLCVMIVTLQTPSNGCWAKEGADAAPVRARAKNTVPMRSKRMNQFLDDVMSQGLFGANVAKICCAAVNKITLHLQ
jgi:hypothetical protein